MLARSSLVLGLVVAFTVGCGTAPEEILRQARVAGDSGLFAGSRVDTWATFHPGGAVAQVGLTLPAIAVDSAAQAQSLDLTFPAEVREATFLNHLRIQYTPTGDGPTKSFHVERFDFQFFGVDVETQSEIDCVGEPMPTTTTLPPSYFVPGTSTPPEGSCVGEIGVLAYDTAAPVLEPQKPAPLTSTLALGYHNGSLVAVDAMTAAAELDAGADFWMPVPALELLGEQTLFPSSVSGIYDPETDAYLIFAEDFTTAN